MRIAAVVLVSIAALALVGSASGASGGCHDVSGTFVAVTVVPPECPSFFCTRGTLSGDLAGTYFFAATGVTPAGDLTGASTITLENGAVINGSDTSHLNADGTFVTTVTFVGGTRQFAHAEGQLVAAGHFTATGTEGTYSGTICLGAEEDDD
jgi:hypothetical protein